jgi:hypothetical protein
VIAGALLVGLFAAGATMVTRELAPLAWLMVRPLSCDLCMSWWGSWLGVVALLIAQGAAWSWRLVAEGTLEELAAIAVSLLVLKVLVFLER